MRATPFIFSLLFAVPAIAIETFDMALPDDLPSTSSYQAPAASVNDEVEAANGSYESAFTSFRSKKSEDDEVVDKNDSWRKNQEKPDNFDVETLTYNKRNPAAIEDSEVTPSQVSAKERKAMIMQTISQNYPDLKTCYQDGLRQNSAMKGKVVMGWAMDKLGRVTSAEVQTSQLNNKKVETCMLERLSNWRFPQQAKLQGSKDRMTYTFQFVPEKD